MSAPVPPHVVSVSNVCPCPAPVENMSRIKPRPNNLIRAEVAGARDSGMLVLPRRRLNCPGRSGNATDGSHRNLASSATEERHRRTCAKCEKNFQRGICRQAGEKLPDIGETRFPKQKNGGP